MRPEASTPKGRCSLCSPIQGSHSRQLAPHDLSHERVGGLLLQAQDLAGKVLLFSLHLCHELAHLPMQSKQLLLQKIGAAHHEGGSVQPDLGHVRGDRLLDRTARRAVELARAVREARAWEAEEVMQLWGTDAEHLRSILVTHVQKMEDECGLQQG